MQKPDTVKNKVEKSTFQVFLLFAIDAEVTCFATDQWDLTPILAQREQKKLSQLEREEGETEVQKCLDSYSTRNMICLRIH